MGSDGNSNSLGLMFFMYVPVTYKNEDQMRIECARVVSSQNIIQLNFRRSRAANSAVGDRL